MKLQNVRFALITVCLIVVVGVFIASAAPVEDNKAALLACLKEMTDFCKSEGPTDFFVDGKPDETRFQVRMEKIALKHFKDIAAFEAAAKEFEGDPDYKKAEQNMLKVLLEVVNPPDKQKAPETASEAQKPATPEEKTNMLAFIREMTDFLQSDAARDLFVDGRLDKARFSKKVEEIALKRFKDTAELDASAKRLQNDPEIKAAGEKMVKARQDCQKKYGAPPPAPKE